MYLQNKVKFAEMLKKCENVRNKRVNKNIKNIKNDKNVSTNR